MQWLTGLKLRPVGLVSDLVNYEGWATEGKIKDFQLLAHSLFLKEGLYMELYEIKQFMTEAEKQINSFRGSL